MSEGAEDLYVALLSDGKRLAGLRRLTYRCAPSRCLLLDAIETPLGIVLHQKRYKYSSEVNQTASNEAGRARNTYDGRNHWQAQSYFLAESTLAYPDDLETRQVSIQCDDVLNHRLTAPDFRADWDAGHSEVLVRRDGSRYAVR